MALKLYTIFYYCLLPLIILRLFYRAIKAPAYIHRIRERFGFFLKPEQVTEGGIWVHAVSVGEVIAAEPLVRQLQLRYPARSIVVTTMTPTGSERVRALFGDTVFHVYAPYDTPGSVGRFLDRVNPRLLIIMETELWPNIINGCYRREIPAVLVNGRLSEKSAGGYRVFRALAEPMLQQLALILAQGQADAERFIQLGGKKDCVQVTGSVKFDLHINNELKKEAQQLKAAWNTTGERFIWIAASTHEGEDAQILDAFKYTQTEQKKLLLVLVPRHPERFDQVVHLSESLGLNTLRYSSGLQPNMSTQVVVGDVMGELLLLYGCADLAFVGGSLVERGGHNMLEPAAWGLPILTGKSDFNFSEISQLLQRAGALEQVTNSFVLEQKLLHIITDSEAGKKMGAAALQVIERNRGALNRVMAALESYTAT